MEPCLEKEMVHHYKSGGGRGRGRLDVGWERRSVGVAFVSLPLCLCRSGDSVAGMGKLDLFFFMW